MLPYKRRELRDERAMDSVLSSPIKSFPVHNKRSRWSLVKARMLLLLPGEDGLFPLQKLGVNKLKTHENVAEKTRGDNTVTMGWKGEADKQVGREYKARAGGREGDTEGIKRTTKQVNNPGEREGAWITGDQGIFQGVRKMLLLGERSVWLRSIERKGTTGMDRKDTVVYLEEEKIVRGHVEKIAVVWCLPNWNRKRRKEDGCRGGEDGQAAFKGHRPLLFQANSPFFS